MLYTIGSNDVVYIYVRIFDSGEVENGDLDNGVDYYFFIITKAMIIVTLSRKTLQGTLQSLKCNADAEIRRQNVRTDSGCPASWS